jgi:hypothetical protein
VWLSQSMTTLVTSSKSFAQMHAGIFLFNCIHYICRYVLTRWVEKMIPLRRLTTIVMPHRGAKAELRKQPTQTRRK